MSSAIARSTGSGGDRAVNGRISRIWRDGKSATSGPRARAGVDPAERRIATAAATALRKHGAAGVRRIAAFLPIGMLWLKNVKLVGCTASRLSYASPAGSRHDVGSRRPWDVGGETCGRDGPCVRPSISRSAGLPHHPDIQRRRVPRLDRPEMAQSDVAGRPGPAQVRPTPSVAGSPPGRRAPPDRPADLHGSMSARHALRAGSRCPRRRPRRLSRSGTKR